jgi:uncharacterized membrane protein required for colicin V production
MADLVLLGIFAGFARGGWSSGFVRRLAGIIFIVVGFLAAAYLRTPVGALVHTFLPRIPEQYAETIGYSVAFGAITIGLNLVSGVILSRVPKQGIARRTDQLLGVAFGLLEGVVLLSAGIVILHTYTDPANQLSSFANVGVLSDLREAIDASTIGKLLEDTTVPIVLLLLGPFLPTDIKQVVPTQIPGGLPFFPTKALLPG